MNPTPSREYRQDATRLRLLRDEESPPYDGDPPTRRTWRPMIPDEAVCAEVGAVPLAVYVVLMRHADNKTGECWPSHATIAKTLGLSVNSVKKALKILADQKLVIIRQRRRTDSGKASNLYRLPHRQNLPMGGSKSAYTHRQNLPIPQAKFAYELDPVNYIQKEQHPPTPQTAVSSSRLEDLLDGMLPTFVTRFSALDPLLNEQWFRLTLRRLDGEVGSVTAAALRKSLGLAHHALDLRFRASANGTAIHSPRKFAETIIRNHVEEAANA